MADPDPKALAWVRAAAGAPDVAVVRRLVGSSTGDLHVVRPTGGPMAARDLVLRRYTIPALVRKHPDLAAREAHVLARLAGTGLPAPELVAVDPDGRVVGVPAVLMTLVPGEPRLQPDATVGLDRWLDGLAGVLAAVHAASGTGLDPIGPWFTAAALAVPEWATDPGPWRAAFAELTASGPPDRSGGLVHRDLHPGNVLWEDGDACGVVDWVNAGSGSPAADLARCRANLALLAGVPAAQELLRRYRAGTGRPLADQRWWDLADLASVATIRTPGATMLGAMVAGPAQLGVVIDPAAAGAALEELLRTALAS